jgi:hypothetical protein
MQKFLSDEWFINVEKTVKELPGLDIAKAMKDVIVNLTLKTGSGEVLMRIDRGIIIKGHSDAADVQMSMPEDYAYKLLVIGDWSVGMKGYVARKISVSGNMRKLIPLQVFKPTNSQVELREKIKSFTEFAS